MGRIDTIPEAVEGMPVDYTTTDEWGEAAVLGTSAYNEVTIFIKNTGSNDADIAVYTKVNTAGQIEYLEYTSTLAPGDVAKVLLNGRYARVIVRAKNTIAGSSTTIRVEWIGGRQ